MAWIIIKIFIVCLLFQSFASLLGELLFGFVVFIIFYLKSSKENAWLYSTLLFLIYSLILYYFLGLLFFFSVIKSQEHISYIFSITFCTIYMLLILVSFRVNYQKKLMKVEANSNIPYSFKDQYLAKMVYNSSLIDAASYFLPIFYLFFLIFNKHSHSFSFGLDNLFLNFLSAF